jgi:hypothetical protein
LQTSKEPCPVCGEYAIVDVKTEKISCKIFCEGNGKTRAEAKAISKSRKQSDADAERKVKEWKAANPGKVYDPWAK